MHKWRAQSIIKWWSVNFQRDTKINKIQNFSYFRNESRTKKKCAKIHSKQNIASINYLNQQKWLIKLINLKNLKNSRQFWISLNNVVIQLWYYIGLWWLHCTLYNRKIDDDLIAIICSTAWVMMGTPPSGMDKWAIYNFIQNSFTPYRLFRNPFHSFFTCYCSFITCLRSFSILFCAYTTHFRSLITRSYSFITHFCSFITHFCSLMTRFCSFIPRFFFAFARFSLVFHFCYFEWKNFQLNVAKMSCGK